MLQEKVCLGQKARQKTNKESSSIFEPIEVCSCKNGSEEEEEGEMVVRVEEGASQIPLYPFLHWRGKHPPVLFHRQLNHPSHRYERKPLHFQIISCFSGIALINLKLEPPKFLWTSLKWILIFCSSALIKWVTGRFRRGPSLWCIQKIILYRLCIRFVKYNSIFLKVKIKSNQSSKPSFFSSQPFSQRRGPSMMLDFVSRSHKFFERIFWFF